MTDSVAVFPPGFRLIDANGDVVAGGSIEFYVAGTTTPKTVYSDQGLTTALGAIVYLDAGGYPVNAQGGTTKVQVYVGTAAYKVIVKTSGGTVLATVDNIRGAFDSASILETLTLIPETKVATLTGDTTLTAASVGQLHNCNTTGGAFTVTLPDATALNNGARIGLRMAGTANQLKIKSSGSQTIARSGVTATALALGFLGETVWLVADGGNWVADTVVPPLLSTAGVIVIADILSTPPGSPVPGARYLVGSGPTGAWAAYAQHDIAEADGQGGWFRYGPPADGGWLAYVQDEDAYYAYRGTAWGGLGKGALQVFTTSATYIPTPGLAYCLVIATGGGGGGGGADGLDSGMLAVAGGGGAGGTSIGLFTAAAIGASVAVTVGAGGAEGADTGGTGGTGGTTTFGSLLTATGGAGGIGVSTASTEFSAPGSGGGASGGLLNVPGGTGNYGAHESGSNYTLGGQGGASYWGGGAKGGSTNVAGSSAGAAASAYGAGGGGAVCLNSTTGAAGGAGAGGVVMILEIVN